MSSHRWSPYSYNGGTIVGIAGDDYALIASDTRLCEASQFMIYSRKHPHVYEMLPNLYLGAVGFNGDVLTLTKTLKGRVETYLQDHSKNISTSAFAQMLSVTLYNRRFFPLYVYNIVVGLDGDGKGLVYSYDPVGTLESVPYQASGSSDKIVQPFLDNQLGGHNLKDGAKKYSADEAVKLVRDVFVSAAERDIHCGDGILVKLIKKDGVQEFFFPLSRD